MRGALHVNPWKISEIATAFYQALTMSEDERIRRVSIASEFVTRVTTQRWALAVMLDLKGVQKNEDAGRYAGAGLGLGFRLLGMDSGFNSLDANSVARAYRNAKSRLILLDYGGTILANDNVSLFPRDHDVFLILCVSLMPNQISSFAAGRTTTLPVCEKISSTLRSKRTLNFNTQGAMFGLEKFRIRRER